MARYGVSEYGASFYGAPSLALFSAEPFIGSVIDYGSVFLTWHSPGGTWDELRLIRSLSGYPVSVDNGVEVYSAAIGADAAEFRESGLPTDHWVYYSLFVHDNTQDTWVRSGNARVYSPANYRSGDRLFDLAPPPAQSDALLHFLQVFGFATDLVRNDANSLLDLNDPTRLLYDFVPAAMEQLGIPVETEIEPEQYRTFLRNAVRFYKIKGTTACVHGVVSAVTGWDSRVTTGINILHDAELSDFLGGVGMWSRGASNCTLTWVAPTTDGYGNPVPAAMRLTALATGAISTTFCAPADVKLLGLPIHGGRQYTTSMLVRASDVARRTAHINLRWYDRDGNLLTTTVGAGVATYQGVDTPISMTALAPATAVWVVPDIVIDAADVSAYWEIRQVQVSQSAHLLPHQPGRDIRIAVFADRVNEIPNGSFEAGLAGWAAMGAVTDTVDATRAYVGTRSARVAYTGAGVTNASPPTDGFTFTFATIPGRRYGIQLESALDDSAASTQPLVVEAAMTNAALDTVLVDSDGSPAHVLSGTAGVQSFQSAHFAPGFAFVADSTEAVLVVGFHTARAGHAFNLDAVVIERADIGSSADWFARNPAVVRPYFDGATTSQTLDYFWEGEEFLSRSHYYRRRTIHQSRVEDVLPRYLPFGATFTLVFTTSPDVAAPYVSDDTIITVTEAPVTTPVGRAVGLRWGDHQNNAAVLRLNWDQRAVASNSGTALWNLIAHVGQQDQLIWNAFSNWYTETYGGTY
jgi:phage tail-like protein